jgi:hypothetical protein
MLNIISKKSSCRFCENLPMLSFFRNICYDKRTINSFPDSKALY